MMSKSQSTDCSGKKRVQRKSQKEICTTSAAVHFPHDLDSNYVWDELWTLLYLFVTGASAANAYHLQQIYILEARGTFAGQ